MFRLMFNDITIMSFLQMDNYIIYKMLFYYTICFTSIIVPIYSSFYICYIVQIQNCINNSLIFKTYYPNMSGWNYTFCFNFSLLIIYRSNMSNFALRSERVSIDNFYYQKSRNASLRQNVCKQLSPVMQNRMISSVSMYC